MHRIWRVNGLSNEVDARNSDAPGPQRAVSTLEIAVGCHFLSRLEEALHLLVDRTGLEDEGEASGTPASMVAPNAAYSVRWTLGSTRKRGDTGDRIDWKQYRQRTHAA